MNWVITRDTEWQFDGVKVAHTIEDAMNGALTDAQHAEKASLFIIGGGEIFTQTLAIADRLELTHIDLDVQGDAHYPQISGDFKKVNSEQQIDEKSNISFEFATYQK